MLWCVVLCIAWISVSVGLRPPSVPLIVVDPYISIWSPYDNLYDGWPQHWTGATEALTGLVRVDGNVYRFMGSPTSTGSTPVQQTSLLVTPTSTTYHFNVAGAIHLEVVFTTPSLLSDIQLLSLPITYITYSVLSMDGKQHNVQLYYDNTAEVCTNDDLDMVTWNMQDGVLDIGTAKQKYFDFGTKNRLNWGWWSVLPPTSKGVSSTIAGSVSSRTQFAAKGTLPPMDTRKPRAVFDDWPVVAVVWDFGNTQHSTTYLTIGYNSKYNMQYFGDKMAPLWTQRYPDFSTMLHSAASNYTSVRAACTAFDTSLRADLLKRTNNTQYADICALAYRQVTGAMTSVWNDKLKKPWLFMKEISSDGDVSTVDVIYPSSPLLVYQSVSVVRMLLEPLLVYANNGTSVYGLDIQYNLPWAPHHLGLWPVCAIHPWLQEQMPMEESGNMILMMAAITKKDGTAWLKPWWKLLDMWTEYLNATLPDPKDQLCTDDFEGPSPHNVNLAAKGIVGLDAAGWLYQQDGQQARGSALRSAAHQFAAFWMRNASSGDHSRLQYNLPNTWSLKYNMLFQHVLGLSTFPDTVMNHEEVYYATKMNAYGVPLDSRGQFTKADWQMWVAAMGTTEQFNALTAAVYKFADETPSRVPFSDWYFTESGKVRGFKARPVLGGFFARMLL